ncbi:hypothetical protein SLEP1_g51869 [Rubroshorea leprosula]|uniref:Uncharacterized protein n=1 Tax=Rubroshorea leprosula TaxID=152421 RepID=A0AAV5M4M7_9ROSI|nr:hypothetical protein SLEP1_g51869 [Rubroshorea leprosula]
MATLHHQPSSNFAGKGDPSRNHHNRIGTAWWEITALK